MHFHIITIFPEMFDSYLGEAMLKRAQKASRVKFSFYNPRDFVTDKHKQIDDKPYGGGPGMVMMAEPIIKAAQKAKRRKKSVKTILFSPGGKQFTNTYAKKLSTNYKDIILIAGRYEGVDARVKKVLKAEEVSIGPYILTGGELPAMIVMDAVSRQIPGVLGNSGSVEETRTASGEMYTRPEEIVQKAKKYKVPKVLLSGNHKEIEKWRRERG